MENMSLPAQQTLNLVKSSNAFLLAVALWGVAAFFGAWSSHAQSPDVPSESDYYPVESMPLPEGVVLEATGLAFDDQGDLMVTNRRGEVWSISNPGSDNPSFSKFAQGLLEPLGIGLRDGAWFVAQRGELSKLMDQDDDGRVDVVETVYRWPLSGNYHEYSYGPLFLPNGQIAVTLNVTLPGQSASLAKWRGWMLHITEDGEVTPYAAGLRSPNGMGLNAEGDIFYADNEGRWVPSARITHLEKGDFAGQPDGLRWTHLPESPLDLKPEDIYGLEDYPWRPKHEYARDIPEMKPPAVWLPQKIIGASPSDIWLIENDDQLGPFSGQMLVGEAGFPVINRVYLEKVKGEYQGAVFRFREEGLTGRIMRFAWGPDAGLFIAKLSRFTSGPEEPYGIDVMTWTGDIPFEMKTIEAESNGFTITFTRPVDAKTAGKVESYQLTEFAYPYHRLYYSSPINQETRTIGRVEVADDRRSIRLYVNGLREGYISEVKAEGVRSAEGLPLLHAAGYYTLNNLPEGERVVQTSGAVSREAASTPEPSPQRTTEMPSEVASGPQPSPKRITEMPADWEGGPDQTAQLGTEPGLSFDKSVLTVQAGSHVALTFTNDDEMQHNVVIVEPGAADAVGRAALQLGLQAEALEYVPRMDEVLYHTSLVAASQSETIYFQAPDTPGEYQFICSFAGHYITMRGILRVE